MRYFKAVVCIFMVLMVQSCTNGKTTIRQDIKYVNSWNEDPTVSILEPDIKVTLYAVGRGSVRLKDNEIKIRNYLLENITKQIKEKGYMPVISEFAEDDSDVIALESSYTDISKNVLYPKPMEYRYRMHASRAFAMDESIRYSLMQKLSTKTEANLLMIVRYVGNHNVASLPAQNHDVDMLFNSNAIIARPRGYKDVTHGTLEIALIERDTGKLFWANKIHNTKDFLSCPVTEGIDKVCRDPSLGLSFFPNVVSYK